MRYSKTCGRWVRCPLLGKGLAATTSSVSTHSYLYTYTVYGVFVSDKVLSVCTSHVGSAFASHLVVAIRGCPKRALSDGASADDENMCVCVRVYEEECHVALPPPLVYYVERRAKGGGAGLGWPSGSCGRNRAAAHDLSGQHEAAAGGLVGNRHDMVGQCLRIKKRVAARNRIYEKWLCTCTKTVGVKRNGWAVAAAAIHSCVHMPKQK